MCYPLKSGWQLTHGFVEGNILENFDPSKEYSEGYAAENVFYGISKRSKICKAFWSLKQSNQLGFYNNY